MSNSRIQVIGICRWSYPADGRDFISVSRDAAETRAKLYDHARLEHRLFLLERVMLPALLAQTDPDFTLVLLTGDQLPGWARARLEALTGKAPQIAVVTAPEGRNITDLCRAEMIARRDPDATAVAEFRLDDDDAVAIDFVERVRDLFEDVAGVFARMGAFGLDFSRGFMMTTTDTECSFKAVATRFWTPGLVIFARPDERKCVLDHHHLRLWRTMPVMIWPDRPMFLRGVHHDNDSNIDQVGRRTAGIGFSERKTLRHLRQNFHIDAETLQADWIAKASEFLAA